MQSVAECPLNSWSSATAHALCLPENDKLCASRCPIPRGACPLSHRLGHASPRPALQAAGGKGPLAQEEARWLRLRTEKEGEAIEELKRQRSVLEAEASRSQREGQLCATPFGVDVVGITEFVALTGALVGGGSSQQLCACRLHAGSCIGRALWV